MRGIIGILIALASGVAFSLLLQPSLAHTAQAKPAMAFVSRAPAVLEVRQAHGQAEILDRSGRWVTAVSEQFFQPPVLIRCASERSFVQFRIGDRFVHLGDGGELEVGSLDGPPSLILRQGLFITTGDGAPQRVELPGLKVRAEGQSFGLKLDEAGVVASAMAGDFKLWTPTKPEGESFAEQTRIDYRAKGKLRKSALPDRIRLEVVSLRRSGRSARLKAKVSPGVEVLYKRWRGYQSVKLNADHVFSLYLGHPEPQPGELMLFDSLGRQAEYGIPSRSLRELLDDLKTGQRTVPKRELPEKKRPSKPEPAPKAEPERPKVHKKAKPGPRPLPPPRRELDREDRRTRLPPIGDEDDDELAL